MATRSSPAFTLVELLVATAVTALLMAAIASSMAVAARAIPAADSFELRSTRDRGVVQEVARELSQASTITLASTNLVEFTVPDRTGDWVEETIRYELTGEKSNVLTRSVNGFAVTLADEVTSFQIRYTTGSRSVTTAGPTVEGPERVLSACYKASGGSDLPFNGLTVAMQKFRPVLPPDATSWRVTKANVYLRRDGTTSSTLRASVYRTDAAGTPSGSALATVSLSESFMATSFAWQSIPFGAMSLAPTDGAAIVLANSTISINISLGAITFSTGSTATAGAACFVTDAIAEDGVNLSFTTTGSTSFHHQHDDSLVIEVLGRVTTSTTTTSPVTTIDAVDVSLATDRSALARAFAVVAPRPQYEGSIEIIPDTLPEDDDIEDK